MFYEWDLNNLGDWGACSNYTKHVNEVPFQCIQRMAFFKNPKAIHNKNHRKIALKKQFFKWMHSEYKTLWKIHFPFPHISLPSPLFKSGEREKIYC
jgi:hypothetical protein